MLSHALFVGHTCSLHVYRTSCRGMLSEALTCLCSRQLSNVGRRRNWYAIALDDIARGKIVRIRHTGPRTAGYTSTAGIRAELLPNT